MNITGINGTNNGVQQGVKGLNMGNPLGTDSVSKNIQSQIANAQQKLQDISADKEMSLEDKMKKRQEIQQEITNLNQQLRQHQIEQRKEKQQQTSSANDMLGGTNNGGNGAKTGKAASGLSQASMHAMISADSSMKQAKVQGAMATNMKGKAGVLESEIKMDKGRGGNTEAKEAELSDLQERVQSTTASQISTLADANKKMEEAAKADRQLGKPDEKKEQTGKSEDKDTDNKVTDNNVINNMERVQGDTKPVTPVGENKVSEVTGESALGAAPAMPSPYVSVDVRL